MFYCPVNAPIAQCNVKVGQVVKAGDLLVSFDTTNLERDNQQSELNTLSAKYSSQDAVSYTHLLRSRVILPLGWHLSNPLRWQWDLDARVFW